MSADREDTIPGLLYEATLDRSEAEVLIEYDHSIYYVYLVVGEK